jgi:hypothetical protein
MVFGKIAKISVFKTESNTIVVLRYSKLRSKP